MALLLGIESTCDETAAAVVADGTVVRSSMVATQTELHAKYRGVVPEIASRAHIENILPVLGEAIEKAGVERDQIDAVAVAHRPGLIGSLLVGVTAAKTLAWALGRPLIGVDHVHAHLYSVLLDSQALPPPMPAVGLVVSGGHTALYRLDSWRDVQLIGSTIDDAVGEAYDKAAALLGLGYPGGPILDRLAPKGDANAIRLPRPLLGRDSLDFSFSGLKTALLYHVHGVPTREKPLKSATPPKLSETALADIAASFQRACIDVILEKLRRALDQTGGRCVIIGGGVSANRGLRAALTDFPVPVYFPKTDYCTDNAAMSAGLAHVYFERGEFSDLGLDAVPYSQFQRS